MKKYAFTLAETLLTMTIIGICAAMLIGTIKNVNPSGQADAIMAKKAVTTFTDATRQIMVHYTKNFKMNDVYKDTQKTEPCTDETCLFNLYGQFVQISKILTSENAGGFGTSVGIYGQLNDGLVFGLKYKPACDINEELNTTPPGPDDPAGSIAPTTPVVKACGVIYYDVNGKKGPNVNGRDRFAMPIFKSTGVRIPAPKASANPTPPAP